MVDGFDATVLQPLVSAVGTLVVLMMGTLCAVWATMPDHASRGLERVVSIVPQPLDFLQPEIQFRTATVPMPFQARPIPPPSTQQRGTPFKRRKSRGFF